MSPRSPYRGLAAFGDSDLDALYFFGRERDSEIVVANLIASRLTVLYGPSGVGKSSLLLASVARALRRLPEGPLVVVFSRWNDDPQQALAETLAEAAGTEPGALVDVATRAQADRDVYLILDQAEEYFTYHGDGEGFDRALAALVDGPMRVNVLLSLREDTLASLDRLKAPIPSLFGNVLRLDRLDRGAGRAAIVGPLERWGELEGDVVSIEDELVEDVLDGVGAGRIELGQGGQGVSGANGRAARVEAPYLQLVMERLWEVERSSGSHTLRAETLESLGGAGQVVADHLERAVGGLTPEQRDIAASLFDHLVTPSGTKIAHETSDLAQFAHSTEEDVRRVLGVLADHRILRRDEAGRWEIFHDVLAGAVLGWKSRHDGERAVAHARADARRRHRRLAFLALGALAGLVLMGVLTGWALIERNNARERAREARAHELEARAVTLLPTDTSLALTLATEAARIAPSATAEDVLRQALTIDRLLYVVPVGGAVVEVAGAGRDGFFLASSNGRAVRYAGAAGPHRPVIDLEARYAGPVTTVMPDPVGMLSASSDGTARRTVDAASSIGDPSACSSSLEARRRDRARRLPSRIGVPPDGDGRTPLALGTSRRSVARLHPDDEHLSSSSCHGRPTRSLCARRTARCASSTSTAGASFGSCLLRTALRASLPTRETIGRRRARRRWRARLEHTQRSTSHAIRAASGLGPRARRQERDGRLWLGGRGGGRSEPGHPTNDPTAGRPRERGALREALR